MEKEKINKLIELLEELQIKEYYNEENLSSDDDYNLDIYSCIDCLLEFIQNNYIIKSINAWAIHNKK